MARYKLSDVVMRIKDKVDKDNTDLEFYIGGEHFDNGEICITKRGVIKESTIGPAFHMRFMPGDVLLMSRNPHLRKAGVVDFEGICSDVSYVCRTKDENVLMQRFLPFIFQTDDFWKFAEENKGGSTNFFLNWSDFERYEFELPSIEKQRQLTEILWAAQNTKLAYLELLRQTDELVKSQFIELFGDPEHWSTGLTNLGEHIDLINGFAFLSSNFVNEGIPVIKIRNVNTADFSVGSMQSHPYDPTLTKYEIYPGDILISLTGTVGKEDFANVCIADNSYERYYLNQRNAKLVPHGELSSEFLVYVLKYDYIKKKLIKQGTGVRQCHLHNKDIYGEQIIIPDLGRQMEFSKFIQQTDKSKYCKQNHVFSMTRGGELCA